MCIRDSINTYYTLTGLDKRWTDMDKHEMYCAGHMIEAGIAYLLATGDRTLLEVSTRMVGHMMNEFGPGKRHWVPGHEEIELALAKLYSVTGEPKYLEFARCCSKSAGTVTAATKKAPGMPLTIRIRSRSAA